MNINNGLHSKTDENPAISVVIPAYNAAKTIARTVDSVLKQSYPATEVIVVDDGSQDETRVILEGYGSKIRYLYQENAGVSAARNAGVRAAQNEWIAFLDADDTWRKGRLCLQVEILHRYPQLNWVTGNYVTHFLHSQRPDQEHYPTQEGIAQLAGKGYWDDYFKAFPQGATGWTGTKLVRKKLLEQAGFFRLGQQFAEDVDMWWRVAYLCPEIGYVAEPIADYYFGQKESLTQTAINAEVISDFIGRHKELARSADMESVWQACASSTARYWLHKFIAADKISEAVLLAQRLSPLLPKRDQWIMRLLGISPRFGQAIMPILRKMNRYLGFRF